MLLISKYAEKLNAFFRANYQRHELHYLISVQLNFSIEVSLSMSDSFSYSREQFRTDYFDWLTKSSQSYEDVNIKEQIRKEYEEDCKIFFESGSVKFYISEFGDPGDPGVEENANGIQWGSRFRLTSLFHQSNDEPQIGLPPIVTFYSYKGGMGRTTTLMGFALWLASKDKRVAIIDCDLEAPGYLNFFNLGNQHQFIDGNKNGFVEFMADYSFLKNGIELERYCVTPTAPDSASSHKTIYDNIFIVPGGNLNDGFITEKSEEDDETEFEATNRIRADRNRREYIEGLSRLNLSNPTVLKRSYTALIKKLQDSYNIDIVLIDSRTGFNDIYGSTAFDLADNIVAFFGFSKQTIPGLRQLLDSYSHAKKSGQNLSLTICNSILPSQDLLSVNTDMQEKWNGFEKKFASQISKNLSSQSEKRDTEDVFIEVPTIYPIHRRVELEELGMSDDADANFLNMVVLDSFEDYSVLFASIFNELAEKYPILQTKRTPQPSDKRGTSHKDASISEPLESIRHMRPLQLTKIILRELKPKLQTVKNFAEHMDVQQREMFLYRDCMKEIFNPSKFIVRGYKGAGKTCIYQALGRSNDVADFIRTRAEISFDCDFINVIDFDGISNHPLKLLEDDGVFAGHRFYNINAFWQILMWNAIFSKEEYRSVLDRSAIKERLFTFKGSNGASILNSINEMIEGGASRVLAAIEDDLTRLDEYLTTNNLKLFIMYDGLDNVVKPKYWGKAVSPLINKWGGNVTAYKNIHPKIFLRTDLFDRIEGTNIERLKDNIIDIDWDIAEVFGYLFKLVLGNGNNPSREAMWSIIRILRPDTADNHIKNMTKAIENGLGQFPTFDEANLKPLVEIFFGREVNPQRAHLGRPWQYFEKQLSNAAGKISMRLFINTLTCDVIEKGLENSNPHVTEVISPDLYASREVRIKVAESYFNDMASEEDFTDDLQKLREYINSENGKEYRKKVLSELEFNTMINNIISQYRNDLHAIETPAEFAQLIYASGLMKEIYKRGHKVYRFSPMFEYPWGLVGKSIEEDEDNAGKTQKYSIPKEGDILEGTLTLNPKGRRTVVTDDGYAYECEDVPYNIKLNTRVRFTYIRRKKIGGGYHRMSANIERIK